MPITITGIVLFGIALAIYRFTLTDWSTKRLSKNGLVHGVINSIVVALVSIAIGVIGLLILFVGLVVEVLLYSDSQANWRPNQDFGRVAFFAKNPYLTSNNFLYRMTCK